MFDTNSRHYRYKEGYGHYCRLSISGKSSRAYMMIAAWIDVDNEVWEEPYHLYGTF